MWNAALRRIVRDEEEREREKRVATQLRLKREATAATAAAAIAATATTASTSTTADTANPAAATASVAAADGTEQTTNDPTVTVNGTAAIDDINIDDEDEEDDDDDDDAMQRHLLSLPTSKWTCLEDSQQACSLAMSRSKRMFAVGERDGRVSIWDNVSIRVITRELDPTLVVIPPEPVAVLDAEERASGSPTATAADTTARDPSDQTAATAVQAPVAAAVIEDDDDDDDDDSATIDDDDDDSATNDDDASVEANEDEDDNDQDEEEENEDDENDEDENEDDDHEIDTVDDDDDDALQVPDTSATNASSTATDAVNTLLSVPQPRGTPGLTRDELLLVKTGLKVVTSCAWSCDTRWLFAGCEEKVTRRGRLCVWDVAAATIFATFSFDAAINCVSAHPRDPDVVVVSSLNALPVHLNVRSRIAQSLYVPLTNPHINTTQSANSRHPSLVAVAKFGTSGHWLYCVTSKSTAAIVDSSTLTCVASTTLSVIIQFIDVAINSNESVLLLTSAKGIHEFVIDAQVLQEVRLFTTGAVRAPWAICCFSDDERFVVGLPVVRHRHVGESGLFTWNRTSGSVQHNAGVRDGVNALVWDTMRDALVAVSTHGALFVFEEAFTTNWAGPMYPAGYRLITDNELHVAAMDVEAVQTVDAAVDSVIDVFAPCDVRQLRPLSVAHRLVSMPHATTRVEELPIPNELVTIPAIPIAQHPQHRHRHQHQHHPHRQHSSLAALDDRSFGLGQSIFEPLKTQSAKARAQAAARAAERAKKKAPGSRDAANATTDQAVAAPKKKRTRNSAISSKRRRR